MGRVSGRLRLPLRLPWEYFFFFFEHVLILKYLLVFSWDEAEKKNEDCPTEISSCYHSVL